MTKPAIRRVFSYTPKCAGGFFAHTFIRPRGRERGFIMTQEETQLPQTAEAEKTFTQQEVDDIVKKRLNRAKSSVPTDYEELKAKAAKLDELETANKTELQKATEELSKLKADLAKRDAQEKERTLKAKVSKETGVPVELISGRTEEDMFTFAERLTEFAKKDTAPKSGHAGQFAKAQQSEKNIYSQIAEQIK